MSTTLGVMLKQLMPDIRISLFESLDHVGAESSDAMNNSGTGHAAYCELNYTPLSNGQVDISKALAIAQSFEISKQFWAYMKETSAIDYQNKFINTVPHMSFVWGEENVHFLQHRCDTMRKAAIFQDMEISKEPDQIKQWAPLIMEGRNELSTLAATKMNAGTDVDFGAITRHLFNALQVYEDVNVYLEHKVLGINRNKSGGWKIQVSDKKQAIQKEYDADFVFIGAGGGSLALLKKTGIQEARGYAGFPISGQFLMCRNPEVTQRHLAKVYGQAEVGTPPMSVPHLDTRIIDGERILFFGPYAGFTTKFLKNGSYLDLFLSMGTDNTWPMISAGLQNMDLTHYLIKQVMLSEKQRFKALLDYYPNANSEDWQLTIAGQRVQVIERDNRGRGVLKFGTEIVSSADGTVAALLGASPGASTSVTVVLQVIGKMFSEQFKSKAWQAVLKKIIPSYGESLIENDDLCLSTRARTSEILGLL